MRALKVAIKKQGRYVMRNNQEDAILKLKQIAEKAIKEIEKEEKAIKEMKKEEMDNFICIMPRKLKERLKINALKHKTNATYIVLDLIKKYLDAQEKEE